MLHQNHLKLKKHNFIIFCPTISGKTNFIKDLCGLYDTVNVFYIDGSEWKGYKVYGI